MTRLCTVCTHPLRHEIDSASLSGMPYRRIATRFGVTESAVRRHGRSHLPQALLAARRIDEITRGDDLIDRLIGMANELHELLAGAKKDRDWRSAVGVIETGRRMVELQAKLLGQLQEQQALTVNVTVNRAFIEIRDDLVRSLEPWPEARSALAQVMIAHAERARQQAGQVAEAQNQVVELRAMGSG